jgi:hypothetical protein
MTFRSDGRLVLQREVNSAGPIVLSRCIGICWSRAFPPNPWPRSNLIRSRPNIAHSKIKAISLAHEALTTRRDQLIAELGKLPAISEGDPQTAVLSTIIPIATGLIRTGLVANVPVLDQPMDSANSIIMPDHSPDGPTSLSSWAMSAGWATALWRRFPSRRADIQPE